jgi:hypothetical protein
LKGAKFRLRSKRVIARRLAEQHGLNVVAVYPDIDPYRGGGRLVDPSGTRSDRPGLVAMLDDAVAGNSK